MTDVLTTRDGLVGNSPRYTGFISPPYQRYLKDDAGNTINLTGISFSAFSIVFVNQSNPLIVKSGAGTFSVPPLTASQGLVFYQYALADVADAGNWYIFVQVQLTGEPSPRVFDPELLSIYIFQGGKLVMSTQDVNLTEVNGVAVSSSNPVPTIGPVTIADGANVAQGFTTDTSSANTQIGLLKAIKAYLAGTLTTSGTMTETNSAAILADANSIVTATNNASTSIGSVGDTTWSGSGPGSEIAILKKLVAELAGTLNVTIGSALPAGTALLGHIIVDSAGSVSVTSLPSLPAGAATIGAVTQASGPWTQNLTQVNGAALSNTNPVPSQDIEQAGYVSASTPPSATNAGSDTPYTFSSQVNRVIIQNNTSANVNYAFDAVASAGSFLLVPGATLIYSKKVTVVHLYTAAIQNVNGSTAANIVILGAL